MPANFEKREHSAYSRDSLSLKVKNTSRFAESSGILKFCAAIRVQWKIVVLSLEHQNEIKL